MKISERAQALRASPTLSLASQAQKLKSEGQPIISLTVGEPDWGTFKPACDAGILAIQEGKTRYTPASGIGELKKEILNFTNSDIGTNYSLQNVTVSAGAKYAIFAALTALLNLGDEVLIPAPFWVSYPDMVSLVGGVPVEVLPSDSKSYKLKCEDLEKKVSPKTKVLMFNSPSNPTGFVYSMDELGEIEKFLKFHPEITLISDDIYNQLSFADAVAPHILQKAPDLSEQVLCLSGVSKSFAMTGWRIGWAVGPEALIAAMGRIQSQSTGSSSSISQWASVAAIQTCREHIIRKKSTLISKRDLFLDYMQTSGSKIKAEKPEGAFYLWLSLENTKYKNDSKSFCETLLREQYLATVPGVYFGVEGFVRASYAIPEDQIEEAVKRLNLMSA